MGHGDRQPEMAARVVRVGAVDLAIYEWSPATEVASGTPFLLVHGLASNGRLWDGVARTLAAVGHPTVAVDQRGHGRSAKPDGGFDMATIADDLAALVAMLGWSRPVAVGQSWGGNVVLELAARHPGVLRGIACVDGGFIDLQERFTTWDDCARALAPPALAGTPATQMRERLLGHHADWSAEAIDGAMANFEVRADGTIAPWLTFDRHLAVLRGMWEHHPLERLDHVDVPVLWMPADSGDVAWTNDKRRALDAAASRHRCSTVHWFSPADHDVHAQHPHAVAGALDDASRDLFR